MKVHKAIRGCLAGILCLAFLVLSFNSVYNQHYHKFDNGVIVQHAHPYKDTGNAPFKTHKHSRFELLFLHFHSLPILMAVGILLWALYRLSERRKRVYYPSPFHSTYSLLQVKGRAPPVC